MKPKNYENAVFVPEVPGGRAGTETIDASKIKQLANISEKEATDEIYMLLYPATVTYSRAVEEASNELINDYVHSGELSDKAYSRFMDAVMLATVAMYDSYQNILRELGTPMGPDEIESKKQLMIDNIVNTIDRLLDKINEHGLFLNDAI